MGKWRPRSRKPWGPRVGSPALAKISNGAITQLEKKGRFPYKLKGCPTLPL